MLVLHALLVQRKHGATRYLAFSFCRLAKERVVAFHSILANEEDLVFHFGIVGIRCLEMRLLECLCGDVRVFGVRHYLLVEY